MRKAFMAILFSAILSFHVYAGAPPDRNPWLLESVTFKTNLPITVEQILRQGGQDGSYNIVVNPTTTSIFFITKEPSRTYSPDVPHPYPSELLKAGYNTTIDQSDNLSFYKLENGNTYRWLNYPSGGQKYNWSESVFYLNSYELVNNKSSYCIIPVLNVNGCQPNSAIRPANLQLPKPEQFILEGYFNDKKVLLEGTVSFELNPGYSLIYAFSDPGSTSTGSFVAPITILLFIVMMFIWLLLKIITNKD